MPGQVPTHPLFCRSLRDDVASNNGAAAAAGWKVVQSSKSACCGRIRRVRSALSRADESTRSTMSYYMDGWG